MPQGAYRPFDVLTSWSFRQAAAEAGLALSPSDEERIMSSYNRLDAFPEVGAALAALAGAPSLDAWVFSNGTGAMVTASLRGSPSLSRALAALRPDKVVSVDGLGVYKPDARAYAHLAERVGAGLQDGGRHRVWLVSANPFDAAGAVAAGLRSAWVDRAGQGWLDGLSGALGIEPTVVVGGVDEAVAQITLLSAARE